MVIQSLRSWWGTIGTKICECDFVIALQLCGRIVIRTRVGLRRPEAAEADWTPSVTPPGLRRILLQRSYSYRQNKRNTVHTRADCSDPWIIGSRVGAIDPASLSPTHIRPILTSKSNRWALLKFYHVSHEMLADISTRFWENYFVKIKKLSRNFFSFINNN